jgi:hypothetical protein
MSILLDLPDPPTFTCNLVLSSNPSIVAMRFSIRPTAAVRQAFARRYASTEAQNPQVKNAVESASKAYDNAIGTAKRVAGPLGERAGNMLGGTFSSPLKMRKRLQRLAMNPD